MHPALDQLQKILRLEIKDGYPNKAVIGGLPKLLRFWEPNARRAGLDAAFIDAIIVRINAYPDLPQAERPAAVEAMLALINQAAAGNERAKASAPAEPNAAPAPAKEVKIPPPARPQSGEAPRPPERKAEQPISPPIPAYAPQPPAPEPRASE
ncbi:MAG: hypothetical protein ACREBU_13085, partial [Nitrososphaera sp.]